MGAMEHHFAQENEKQKVQKQINSPTCRSNQYFSLLITALSTQPPQKPPPFTDLLPSPAAARRHHTSTTSHGGTLIHLINTSAIFSVKLDSESHLNYTQKRNSLTFFPLFFLSPNNITRFFLHLFAVFLGGLFIARNWYLPICSN
ncbi:hypothetical protein Droror1_Dr00002000 [Drosera rotundifolia]